MSENRFMVDEQKISGVGKGLRIITDTKTGVQYIYTYSGYSGGMTVLLDTDGKPLLNKEYAVK